MGLSRDTTYTATVFAQERPAREHRKREPGTLLGTPEARHHKLGSQLQRATRTRSKERLGTPPQQQ